MKKNGITEVVVPVLTPTYEILQDLVKRLKNINSSGKAVKVLGCSDVGRFIATLLEQQPVTEMVVKMYISIKALEDNAANKKELEAKNGSNTK